MSLLRRVVMVLILVLCLLPATSAAAPICPTPAGSVYDPFSCVCKTVNAANTAVQNSPACRANGSDDPITGKDGILYKTSRLIALITGIGAVVMILAGALMYQTSAGSPEKAAKALSVIKMAIGGLVIIITAEMALTVVINLLE